MKQFLAITALILALLAAVTLLCGCGGEDKNTETPSSGAQTQEKTGETQASETQAPSGETQKETPTNLQGGDSGDPIKIGWDD